MPTVDLYNLQRQSVGSIELAEYVFDAEVREHLFHEVVRSQLAARRRATSKVKERNEIRGTTAKAWRQKGTGRARQGAKSAPHWVGGGVVHGPRVRRHVVKVNKQTRKAALAAALSRRHQEGRLFVIDDMSLPEIKTRLVAEAIAAFDVSKVLFVDATRNERFELSARNLPDSTFLAVGQLNVYDVLRHHAVMLSKSAVEALHERML